MSQPCVMDANNKCERHQMHHNGVAYGYALGNDPKSIRIREIWDNRILGRRDHTLPEVTPHLTDYDDCPHRGSMVDKTSCGCRAYMCKLHNTVVSTQRRTGLKLCQDCGDYPRKEVIRKSIAGGKYGVVIGSYGMPGVVELSIAAVKRYCGDIPILVADDNTPASLGRQRLIGLPDRWNGVSLVINRENLGHAPGDIRAFRNGLLWAKESGIRYICKLSQRFIFVANNWLQIVSDDMERTNHAISSQKAVHLHMRFQMRTECVFMDVDRCVSSKRFMELIDPPNGKIPTAAEDWFAAAVQEGGLGPVMRCRLMPVDRFEKQKNILWHNTDGQDVYGENDGGDNYRKLAQELNVDLGPEFSAAGWHVIAPNRPDANYHML